MSLNHYNLYLEQVFQLAETIVIKSEDSAVFLNNRISFLYGDNEVDPIDKTSWKYYLNLAGKYHPRDERVIITSLDTLQQIEFSAANLVIHTATAKAYKYGTRYFRELITQYPEHSELIYGSLKPVNEIEAIDADDFSIIGYPLDLVEESEESLITNINKWLKNYKTRWYNKQYNMSDTLHLTALLGIMYQQLVPLIITLRLANCKTSEAHSYHIREYLASNGMLDEYLDFMTRKQALFFYRNINYIERNAGSVETFNWLLEKVLTDRNIPVAEITLSQSDEELLTNYKPTTRFARTKINKSTAEDSNAFAFYTLTELLNKEVQQAPGNSRYINQYFNEIDTKLIRSKTNTLKTKVLESKMTDYTDAGLYSIQDISLDLWCHMSISGQYSAIITYVNKKSNKTVSIPNHVAFLYFIYAYCQVNDIEVEKIPEFFVQRVAIDPMPTVQDLAKVVGKKYVSTDDLNYLISLHTPLESVISTTAFNEFIRKTFVSYKAEHMFAAIQDDLSRRAMLKNAAYRLYKAQREESPYFEQNFVDVFKSFGLQITGLDKEEWATIYKEMYEKSTGLELKLTETQAALQATMVKLFKKLSSYSIQFLSEINRTTIRSVNWSAVRMGDITGYGHHYRQIQLSIINILNMVSKSKDYLFIELENILLKAYVWTTVDLKFIEATINAWQSRPTAKFQININNLVPNMHNLSNCVFERPEELPEYAAYYELPEQDKRDTRDIYQDRVTDNGFIPVIDLNSQDFIPKELPSGYFRPEVRVLKGFDFKFFPDTFDFRTTREFIDLDAYTSNFGELNVKAFIPFKGVEKNNLGFKLTPGPVESIVKSFKYVGGILKNPGFDFSLNFDGDVNIGSFNFISYSGVTLDNFNLTYKPETLNFVYGGGNIGLNLGNFYVVRTIQTIDNFKFVMDKQNIVIGPLVTGSTVLTFKINSNYKVRIKLTFEFNNYPSVTLPNMKLDTVGYTLSNFNFITKSEKLNFVLGTTIDIDRYFFNSGKQEIAFGDFIKDTRELSNFILRSNSVNFGTLNFSLSKQEVGNFILPKLKQELTSFNFYPPDEISFLITEPLTYEIGDVIYDDVTNEISFI